LIFEPTDSVSLWLLFQHGIKVSAGLLNTL
jgi:hypothetical protein